MVMADVLKKLRAYHHIIKEQQKNREAFGIHPVRAVLIGTTSEARARKLMELARHPLVCGPGKRAGLSWLTISPLFTYPAPTQHRWARHALRSYLDQPEVIVNRIWALPDRTMHALGDAEDSTTG
jgi:hypothetical protein